VIATAQNNTKKILYFMPASSLGSLLLRAQDA